MSSIFSLQCLFCKHLNPAGATFCNECGTQLNMQPCEQCGAIDARTATNCHKCGAEFPLPATSGGDTVPGPAIQAEDPMQNPVAFAADDPARLSPEIAAAPAGSRRQRLVAAAALSVALIAGLASVYLYDRQPASVAQKQGVNQPAPDVAGRPNNPAGPMPLPMSAQTDVALTPTGVATGQNIATDGLAKAPAQFNADAEPTQRPMPANQADANIRQAPSILKECPQAVATLGLCSPDSAAGKQKNE